MTYAPPRTKMARRNAFRVILEKYESGDYVRDDDKERLTVLLSTHPHWRTKVGKGIRAIQVVTSPYGHKCVHLHRVDGTDTDISYLMAVKAKESTLKERITRACRQAIRPRIEQAQDKVAFGTQRCQLSGVVLTRENTHIDHYDLTFAELVNQWLHNKDLDVIERCLNEPHQDNVYDDSFIDDALRADFITFHDTHTHLRAITNAENLRLNKRHHG